MPKVGVTDKVDGGGRLRTRGYCETGDDDLDGLVSAAESRTPDGAV